MKNHQGQKVRQSPSQSKKIPNSLEIKSPDNRFNEGVKKFNKGKFFEAHDIFEDIWFDTKGDDKDFYQGLIHLAAGLHHRNKKNLTGTSLQLKKAIIKLHKFTNSTNIFLPQINIKKLITDSQKILSAPHRKPLTVKIKFSGKT